MTCCCFTLAAIWQGLLAARLHLCLSSLAPSLLVQSQIGLAIQTPAQYWGDTDPSGDATRSAVEEI